MTYCTKWQAYGEKHFASFGYCRARLEATRRSAPWRFERGTHDRSQPQLVGHYLLSAEAGFSAAHRLPGVEQCDQLHGHNWRVRISVQVQENDLDKAGMGVDFRVIEQVAHAAVTDFDRTYLNDLEPFRDRPPTAEQVARTVFERSEARLKRVVSSGKVVEVEAWELPHFRVTYRPD